MRAVHEDELRPRAEGSQRPDRESADDCDTQSSYAEHLESLHVPTYAFILILYTHVKYCTTFRD